MDSLQDNLNGQPQFPHIQNMEIKKARILDITVKVL